MGAEGAGATIGRGCTAKGVMGAAGRSSACPGRADAGGATYCPGWIGLGCTASGVMGTVGAGAMCAEGAAARIGLGCTAKGVIPPAGRVAAETGRGWATKGGLATGTIAGAAGDGDCTCTDVSGCCT
ncbi:MAG: hypothetical protein RBS84_01870 [Kiritimatiellia bacterium]|nr:hypothetical protein [Kiritimatiellia bacterium]